MRITEMILQLLSQHCNYSRTSSSTRRQETIFTAGNEVIVEWDLLVICACPHTRLSM